MKINSLESAGTLQVTGMPISQLSLPKLQNVQNCVGDFSIDYNYGDPVRQKLPNCENIVGDVFAATCDNGKITMIQKSFINNKNGLVLFAFHDDVIIIYVFCCSK